MKIKGLLTICSVVLALNACKEEKHAPAKSSDWKPDPVRNISVENLHGAARLTYSLTEHPELMYVVAEFNTHGTMRNAKTSYYNNTLLLEGFGDTSPYEVNVYAVSRSEVYSDPVTITVNPQTPPAALAYESLTIREDFGGAWATFTNEAKADLGITIMHKDETDNWVTDEVLYTEKESGGLAARGLEAKPTVFGIYVQDRWGNYSDTLIAELTPIFERVIPKPFTAVVLPGDNTTTYSNNTAGYGIHHLWDGEAAGALNTIFYTAVNSGVPTWFTFDLGVTTRLSRFLYQQRSDVITVQWSHGNPRYFEVWGRADMPNPDGSWDGWTKLMDVESVKPSGLPVGQNTDEDLELLYRGEEFTFPQDIPEVRYIRIKVNETWNKQTFIHIAELTFWGQ